MELKRFICPVGQGGLAIEHIGDYSVVYDCGSVSSPYMVSKSIDRLSHEVNLVNILFISHFDRDHVNGIEYLLNRVKVKKAVTSLIPDDLKFVYGKYTNGAYSDIMTLLRNYNVEIDEIGDKEGNAAPYGYNAIWEWLAKSMMTKGDFAKVENLLQVLGIDLNKLEADPIYLDKVKENINNAFKTVFGAKGPNAKGLVVLSQRCKNTVTRMSMIYQGCEWPTKNTTRLASFESSCLYVGDADLKNRTNKKELKDFLKKYRVETPFMLMQIPHHGSKYNIGASFEKDFDARYYFVNDIDTDRLEKNPVLYNSLTSQKKLLLSGGKCTDMYVAETVIK